MKTIRRAGLLRAGLILRLVDSRPGGRVPQGSEVGSAPTLHGQGNAPQKKGLVMRGRSSLLVVPVLLVALAGTAWGEVNRIRYNGISLLANGAAGALGVFRVATAGAPVNGVQTIRSGDGWVGVIEFGDTPRAKVLLSYGNSTQKDSPHFGDQLRLFSEKKLRDAWRTEQQLEGNIVSTETFHNGSFIEVTK